LEIAVFTERDDRVIVQRDDFATIAHQRPKTSLPFALAGWIMNDSMRTALIFLSYLLI
jgi:hypothetical protein